jgi:hypothetical protein
MLEGGKKLVAHEGTRIGPERVPLGTPNRIDTGDDCALVQGQT